MQRFLSKSLSLLPSRFVSPQTLNYNFITFAVFSNSSLISSSASIFILSNKFSNNSNSVTPKDEDDDDVSNEELKRRIEKYYEGDEDAIPSIFEAILKRKLAGKHEESDNELLEEFGSKSPNDQDFDSE